MSADRRADLTGLLTRLCAAAPSLVAWKNLDEALAGTGDIDLIADASDEHAIEAEARAWIAERITARPLVCRHTPGGLVIVARIDGHLLMLDVKTRGTWRSGLVFTAAQARSLSTVDPDGIRRIRPGAEAVLTVVMNGMAPWGRERTGRLDRVRVAALIERDPDGLEAASAALGPAASAARRAVRRFAAGGWSRIAGLLVQFVVLARIARYPMPALQKLWFRAKVQRTCRGLKRELGDDPDEALLAHWLPRHADHTVRTAGDGAGRVLMLAGPDGAGKTSLVLGLLDGILAGVPTKRVHHRDGISILPARKNVGPSTQPHRHQPYPVPLAIAKVLYIWADVVVGWFIRVRPFIRSGGWVILERAWWDMAVDQRRYRLQGVGWLVRALGRFVPTPDVVFMMEAPPEVIHARKAELPLAELARQIDVWPSAIPAGARVARLDVTKPPADVVAQAEATIGGLGLWPGARWVALPDRGSPRVWVPRGPRAMAAAGLTLFHPVTPKGRTLWRAARRAARAGAFRAMPSAVPPPVLRPLREHLGGVDGVALARATHAGRTLAAGLTADGTVTAIVKLASDERGRAALADEAAALTSIARTLTGAVRAPELRAKADGALVLEPVAWILNDRPSSLPVEVAEALGAFWAAGRSGDRGPTHGDLAPWNLLKTRQGWVLIDWERAADGPAFADVAHFIVQAHAYLGSPTAEDIVEALRGRGDLARCLAAYADAAGVDTGAAPGAVLAVLRAPAAASEADDPKAPAARAAKLVLLARLEREGFA